MNAKHSSASQLWYTPSNLIEAARHVLGSIDFDPASDATANETVKASRYCSERGSAWVHWPLNARIWINPPGGKDAYGGSNQTTFWSALMSYLGNGYLKHAIFLAFSIEALQTTQSCEWPMMRFPLCIPSKRIRFVSPEGIKNSPTHANAIIYVPGTEDATDRFMDTFSEIGACKGG